MKIHVIGAGFSGLTTAYFLRQEGFGVEIWESSPQIGGLIHSPKTEFGFYETAANAVLNNREFEDICNEIGLELVPLKKTGKKRFIFRGRPRQWPLSFWETLQTIWTFLWASPRSPKPGESIRKWGERVLGRSATFYLLETALQGIYAGFPERMSASLILGRFFSKAPKKIKPDLRGSVAPLTGMEEFLTRLAEYLKKQGVLIHTEKPYPLLELGQTPVVIAASIKQAADLLKSIDHSIGTQLEKMELLSLVTVSLFFPKGAPELQGFGCLFPRDSGFQALGMLAESRLFLGRTTPGHHSERWIFRASDLPSDKQAFDQTLREREKLLGPSPQPVGHFVTRWNPAIPHYTLELEEFLKTNALGNLESQNIFVAGNWTGQLGLGRILLANKEVAEKIRAKYHL